MIPLTFGVKQLVMVGGAWGYTIPDAAFRSRDLMLFISLEQIILNWAPPS